MFDMTKETGAFHNIYKTGIGAETEKRILHEGNESGEGTMRRFEVAPGIQITYNDLKMDSCFRPIRFEKDFLQINHCLEGCYECELEGGSVSFLGEGDLCVDYLSKDRQVFLGSRIPLKKYRGITVLLEMETAQQTLDQGFQQAHISLEQIKEHLCSDGRSLIIKSKHEIDHIFSEFYSVDERIQVPYFWIKVIELLLFFKSPGWQRSLPTATVFCGHLQTDTGCLPVHYRKSLYQRYHSGSGLYVRTGRVQLKKMFQIYCRDLHRHLCQDETHGGCCRYVGFRADFEHWGDWKCGGI